MQQIPHEIKMAPVADRIFHHNNGVGSAKAEMRFLVHSVVPRPMKDPSRSHKGPRTEGKKFSCQYLDICRSPCPLLK